MASAANTTENGSGSRHAPRLILIFPASFLSRKVRGLALSTFQLFGVKERDI